MCGIIGYTGQQNALPILLEGLYSLLYRGYDSAGVAFFENGNLRVIKSEGKVDNLAFKIGDKLASHCGIGHTRWATHGKPSDINSHPHGTERLYIVHNGIIENYSELKTELIAEGYSFQSETDSEVAAKLIDYYFGKTSDPVLSLRLAAGRFRGSFAIAAVFLGFDSLVYGIRRGSPLIAALSDSGNFIASDIAAVLRYTDRYIEITEDETAVVGKNFIKIIDSAGIEREWVEKRAEWTLEAAEKGGYAHFMLKEIFEESDVLTRTLSPHIKDSLPNFLSPLLSPDALKNYGHIHIVACGTAYHAGLVGKAAIERLCRMRVSTALASEFRYSDPIIDKNDLVIVISQSGETADTLAALRLAKQVGAATLAIVNVVGSSVAREADDTIFTLCGPEIAVASTKAYTVQIGVLYLLALHIAYSVGALEKAAASDLTEELSRAIPKKIESVFGLVEKIKGLAAAYANSQSIFFIGRGFDYALSREAALKCKEISYIHCEGYAAGELKHGTISLIEEGTPVIALMGDPAVSDKVINGVREVKSRGADVLILASGAIEISGDCADKLLQLPDTSPLFSPLVFATAVQLLAYYLTVTIGLDPDKPRNLAKSVTVE